MRLCLGCNRLLIPREVLRLFTLFDVCQVLRLVLCNAPRSWDIGERLTCASWPLNSPSTPPEGGLWNPARPLNLLAPLLAYPEGLC
jgi:hypothetical protein